MGLNKKKALVTGISGFIGSNLTRRLLNDNLEIYGLDNFSYIDSDMVRKKLTFLKDIKLIEGDVSKKETWNNVPTDIDYIFHFAGPSSITLFNRTPEKCFNETVFGLYNTLEFAKKNPCVKKVIYPSTGSLYAGNNPPHKENIYTKPRNSYAWAKASCESLASSYSDFVKSIGLRIFAGYGPGEEWKKDFGSILYLFIRDSLNENPPVIFGDGNQTRDFVYIDNIVEAIVKSSQIDYTGIVNVGTGIPVSFNNLLEIIQKETGNRIPPKYIKKDQNYVENLKADTGLMKKLINIEPIPVEEGIKKFVGYLKNQHASASL